jgi:alcohol dehydrogenase class IV
MRLPTHIGFGPDALEELGSVVCGRVLVVTDEPVVAAGIVRKAVKVLDYAGIEPTVFAGAAPNPAREHVERCRDVLAGGEFDAVIGLGGGSAIDVAKAAVALHAAGTSLPELYGLGRAPSRGVLPVIAVPTTPCTGAEVSAHATIADPVTGRKHAISGPALVPAAAIIQPDLCVTLPWQPLIAGVLDGFLHAVEAYLARGATVFTDTFAVPATRLITAGLPRLMAGEPGAYHDLSLGCLHAGIAMAGANAGLVHALGYPLTTHHGIQHGLANALVAPAVLTASQPFHARRAIELAAVLGASDLAHAVRVLLDGADIRPGLRSYGVAESDIPTLAEQALTYGPIRDNWLFAATRDDIEAMYHAAL